MIIKIISNLTKNYSIYYWNFLRLDIEEQDTTLRDHISPDSRLAVTSSFFATGNWYEDLKFNTGVLPEALDRIIPETCDALFEVPYRKNIPIFRANVSIGVEKNVNK